MRDKDDFLENIKKTWLSIGSEEYGTGSKASNFGIDILYLAERKAACGHQWKWKSYKLQV